MRVGVAAVAVGCLVFSAGLASAQPDTTVVNPPPVPIPTEVTPPPLTITLPPPPPPVTTTVTAPPPPPVTVTLPPPPPVTTTVTTTVTAPPTIPPPPACGAPITITTGGTYSGCYQSNNANTPAVTISTTAPVTLSRARIIAKGNGVRETLHGVQLTIRDSVFEQQDPGALVDHRAVELIRPASFVFEFNRLTDTDGVWIHGGTVYQMGLLRVNNNEAFNVGRYPHPFGGGCCVQFFQMSETTTADGQIRWNHTRNLPGQSGLEDNISLHLSGGTDSTHKIDIGWNLIDGAYPRTNCQDSCGAEYRGGGIYTGDSGGGHGYVHDNVVVSTTNYGIAVMALDNYANNNLLVNDGAPQNSNFGQAIQSWNPSGVPPVSPPGLHATNTRYNWKRSPTSGQFPCHDPVNCSGMQVSTTEQQARDEWEARRVDADAVVGPRP